MFIDSHCHLSFPDLLPRVPEILQDMTQAQVDGALCISTTLEEFAQVMALVQDRPHLWATVGVHPDNEGPDLAEPSVQDLVERAAHPKVLAIGETGLDYYRLGQRSVEQMQWQRDRFRVHIRAALHCGLPLVVHTRSASADTLELLRQEGAERAGGVFHCFTETLEVARAALDMGFFISFSGILTFKNALDLRQVAAYVPLERCLIETDSPYLAPVPFRGKPNDPAKVPWVAAELARCKGVSVERVGEQTSRNFESLFKVSIPASRAVAVGAKS